MTHRGVYSGLLALTVLSFSLPEAVLAEDKRSRLRPQPSTIQPTIHRHQQIGPAVGYHRYSPPPPSHHHHPGYSPPPPSHHHHHHPHGHRLHVHGPSCAVVIVPYVHVVPVPRWRVSVYPWSFNTGQAMLQIIVTAAEGDIYVDDHYLGPIHTLQGRPIDFPVVPGRHIVYFVHRGHVHPHEVYVEADSMAVVQASLYN